MTKPIIKIHNCETNEVVEQEMTNAQFAQHKQDITDAETAKAEWEFRAEAKAALFKRLGITADEAKLLLA